ncbi:MAG: hypothetical protein IAG13_15905, partial [Deltaproteobacteria bacterium]|nr:hypothetical protein [Nannocystaceae bacterium]
FTPSVWGCLARDGVTQPIAIATERSAPGQTILGRITIPAELAKGQWELVTVITSRPVELADQRCDVAPSDDLRVVREPFAVR